MMDTTYSVSGNGSALKRIRTPHVHDVLSGRGGGINSHEGNRTFREWVRERKNQYNLAVSKAEKARVAKEVINLVKGLDPPGRFLQRDPATGSGSMGWWVEIDETKAMAKTSQALREGAPQIRAAHQDELLSHKKPSRRTSNKSKNNSNVHTYTYRAETPTTPLMSPMNTVTPMQSLSPMQSLPPTEPLLQPMSSQAPPQLILGDVETPSRPEATRLTLPQTCSTSKQEHEWSAGTTGTVSLVPPLTSCDESTDTYTRPSKRVRVEDNNSTPPLAPVPSSPSSVPTLTYTQVPKRSSFGLRRANSLALSDIPGDWSVEDDFVNPFEDESEIENRFFSNTGDSYFVGAGIEPSSGTIINSSNDYDGQQNGIGMSGMDSDYSSSTRGDVVHGNVYPIRFLDKRVYCTVDEKQ